MISYGMGQIKTETTLAVIPEETKTSNTNTNTTVDGYKQKDWSQIMR